VALNLSGKLQLLSRLSVVAESFEHGSELPVIVRQCVVIRVGALQRLNVSRNRLREPSGLPKVEAFSC
jgi:hypothetical protein